MNVTTTKTGAADVRFIKDSRFKSALFTVNLLLPLKKETVTQNAMAAALLTECSADYPTQRDLSVKLMSIYGAKLASSSDKLGSYQMLTFVLRSLDSEYGIGGEDCLLEGLELLYGCLTKPHFDKNGVFCKEDVERVRRRHCDRIRAAMNDKRVYAKERCTEIMYKDEPFGIPETGYLETAENVTAEELTETYRSFFENAEVHIGFVGNSLPKSAEKFALLFKNGNHTVLPNPKTDVEKPQKVTERLSITQGKLVMGFRHSVTGGDRKTYVNMVMADMLGGGPYSLLFNNVREKMGLCYYCSAGINRQFGSMLIQSGIDDINAEKAYNAILEQIEKLKNGDFDDSLLEYSKKGIIDSLGGVTDSAASMDLWYELRCLQSDPVSPKELTELIKTVTKEQVTKSAAGLKLDTAYFLLGKENDSDEANV